MDIYHRNLINHLIRTWMPLSHLDVLLHHQLISICTHLSSNQEKPNLCYPDLILKAKIITPLTIQIRILKEAVLAKMI